MKDVQCSIDNISAMIQVNNLDYFRKAMSSDPYISKCYRLYDGLFDTALECIDGTYIQVVSSKKTVSLHSKQPPENCRISFNPNTIERRGTMNSLQNILSYMKNPRFTQLDFAIDYYGYNLETLNIIPPTALKKEVRYSRSGKLESVTYGTGNGTRRYVFYDKKHQIKSLPSNHPEWWRIEVQRRRFTDDEDYFTNPFEGMECVFPHDFPDYIKAQDKAMLIGLQQCPELWGELKKDLKARLGKIQSQSKQLSPHPSEVFKNNLPAMKLKIEQIFLPASKSIRLAL